MTSAVTVIHKMRPVWLTVWLKPASTCFGLPRRCPFLKADLVHLDMAARCLAPSSKGTMEPLFKALLTAGTVLLVMVAAHIGGRRSAGVVAALPTITAPTLAWLADEHGIAFAISAAVGSIASCGMLAVFALVYARAARSSGCGVALMCGLCGALAVALPAAAASADLTCALALGVASSVLAFAAMPRSRKDSLATRISLRLMLFVAATSAGVAACASSVGPSMGGFATGLLASLPLVAGPVAMAEHVAHGHRAAAHFLRGYVHGLFGKAAFGAVFAWLAPYAGAFTALSLACLCACVVSTVRARPMYVRDRLAMARTPRRTE